MAIVTGGARGIGEATVRLFARHGAKVVIADVEDVLGAALSTSLTSSSSSVTYHHCDVSSEEDVKNVIDSTISRYGKLDVIFNNAGVLGSQSKNRKSIVDFDAEEFDRASERPRRSFGNETRGPGDDFARSRRVHYIDFQRGGSDGRNGSAFLHGVETRNRWTDEKRGV